MKPQTLTEQILSRSAGRSVYAGDYVWLSFDATLITDISAPITINMIEEMRVSELINKERIFAFTDHYGSPPGIREAGAINLLRQFCRKHAVTNFFDIGRSGVSHAEMLEGRLIRPGELLAGTDSHTCSSGAVGAFATGVGSTELAGLWIMGKMWLPVPETIRINLVGELGGEAQAKDAILTLAGTLRANGALQRAIEFGGTGLKDLSMRERFTLCNMSVEIGAVNAICEVDIVTEEWFEGMNFDESTGMPDEGASYAKVIELDLSKVIPVVAKPYNPDNVERLDRLRGDRIKVDQVYVGTCTNGSADDIRSFAEALHDNGPGVHCDVRTIVVPSSQSAYRELLADGTFVQLQGAGCQIMPPGCGACIGTHWGVLADGEVGFFTSNRNFRGRTGSVNSQTYLGSPYLAGIVAARGCIESSSGGRVDYGAGDAVSIEESLAGALPKEGGVAKLAPEEFFGAEGKPVKAIAAKRDNINTDEIIPARHCNTVIPEELAPHALEDYDPSLAARITPGAILVGAENFGCGSSREVAAVALAAAGIGGIVARSFGATFERNCINNALPVLRSREAAERIDEGDELILDVERGEITNLTKKERYSFPPLAGAAADVMRSGSLKRYIRESIGRADKI